MRTNAVEQSIADTDEPDTKLRKDLGTWDLIVFGVAVMVGAGIFTLAASTAGDVAGPSLAFVLAAIACGLAALCYAEFASTVPVAGSAYTFSYATHRASSSRGSSAGTWCWSSPSARRSWPRAWSGGSRRASRSTCGPAGH